MRWGNCRRPRPPSGLGSEYLTRCQEVFGPGKPCSPRQIRRSRLRSSICASLLKYWGPTLTPICPHIPGGAGGLRTIPQPCLLFHQDLCQTHIHNSGTFCICQRRRLVGKSSSIQSNYQHPSSTNRTPSARISTGKRRGKKEEKKLHVSIFLSPPPSPPLYPHETTGFCNLYGSPYFL